MAVADADVLIIEKEKCDFNDSCPGVADTDTRVYNIVAYKRYKMLHDDATQYHEFKCILEKFYTTHMIPEYMKGRAPPLQLLNMHSWDDFTIYICNMVMHRDRNMKAWRFGWIGWVLDFIVAPPESLKAAPLEQVIRYFSHENITCVWYRHPDDLHNYSTHSNGKYKSHMLPWRYLCHLHQKDVQSSHRSQAKNKIVNYVFWNMLEYLLHIRVPDHMRSNPLIMPFLCDNKSEIWDAWWDQLWDDYDPALYDIDWIIIPKYQFRNFRKCKKKFESKHDIHARIMHLSNWIVIQVSEAQKRAVAYKNKKISYDRALRMPHCEKWQNHITLLSSKEYVIKLESDS